MKTRTTTMRRLGGFTLIELMIVVAVAAILTAIALPSYNEYIQRGRRAEARAALRAAAQWLERVATATGSYPTTAPVLPAGLTQVDSHGYTIAISNNNANAFTLTATRAGAQNSDRCGDFTLTNDGTASVVNNAASTTAADCWNR